MSETGVVFRGPFAQCLRHYGNEINRTFAVKYRIDGRKPLVAFADAPDHTVYRWLNGRSTVTGERYLQVLYFLEQNHYDVEELATLPAVVWQVGWLIGHRKISLAEVLPRLRYSDNNFLRLFRRGSAKLTAEHQTAMVALVHQFPDTPVPHIRSVAPVAPVPIPPMQDDFRDLLPSVATAAPPSPIGSLSRRDTEVLAHLIQAALPLAEWMNSPECTEADRQLLRHLTKDKWQDGGILFRLANALNGLCSRKAHELQQNGKR